MAEAATIVGIATFGVQCVNGLQDLRKLYTQMKDAPQDVTQLIEDIGILQNILHDLERQHNAFASFSPPNASWDSARRSCQTAADNIQQILSESSSKIRKSRIRGSIKVVLKKDLIAGYQKRLDRLKLNLVLAQGVFGSVSIAMLPRQMAFHGTVPPGQLTKFTSLVLSEAGANANSARSSNVQPASSATGLTGPAENKDKNAPTLETQTSTLFACQRAAPPVWVRQSMKEYTFGGRWIGRAARLRYAQGYFNLSVNLIWYNVLPNDAEVFQTVMRWDTEGLQYLLQHRQASIHDVGTDDKSLLDLACSSVFWYVYHEVETYPELLNKAVQMLQFLLQAGLTVTHELLHWRWGHTWGYDYRHPDIAHERIIALSYGSSLPDWHIWLDCAFDQWAGDFWMLVEDQLDRPVPGSWIDDEEERMARRRAEPGRFKSLATSRRKRRRYLRMMQMDTPNAEIQFGPLWKAMPNINSQWRGEDDFRVDSAWPPLSSEPPESDLFSQDWFDHCCETCRREWKLPAWGGAYKGYCVICDEYGEDKGEP